MRPGLLRNYVTDEGAEHPASGRWHQSIRDSDPSPRSRHGAEHLRQLPVQGPGVCVVPLA